MTAQQDPTEGHSPLPWFVDIEVAKLGCEAAILSTYTNSVSTVAQFHSYADAALIVRAVNEHAVLQARVEELEGLLRESMTYETEYAGRMYMCCHHCRFDEDAWTHEPDCPLVAALGQEGRDE